jgi:Fe-S cluster biogenesis protein NfuA
MPEQAEFQQRLQTIERLLGEVERAADPNLRRTMQDLVQLIMDLHGAGLERMLELAGSGENGAGVVSRMGRDELVGSLLVLYGLHPLNLDARVGQALDDVRARLRAQTGEVQLLSIRDGAVHLRINATGHGCGSNAETMKETIEEAVYRYAPDVTSLTIDGAGAKPGFVPIEMLQGAL